MLDDTIYFPSALPKRPDHLKLNRPWGGLITASRRYRIDVFKHVSFLAIHTAGGKEEKHFEPVDNLPVRMIPRHSITLTGQPDRIISSMTLVRNLVPAIDFADASSDIALDNAIVIKHDVLPFQLMYWCRSNFHDTLLALARRTSTRDGIHLHFCCERAGCSVTVKVEASVAVDHFLPTTKELVCRNHKSASHGIAHSQHPPVSRRIRRRAPTHDTTLLSRLTSLPALLHGLPPKLDCRPGSTTRLFPPSVVDVLSDAEVSSILAVKPALASVFLDSPKNALLDPARPIRAGIIQWRQSQRPQLDNGIRRKEHFLEAITSATEALLDLQAHTMTPFDVLVVHHVIGSPSHESLAVPAI
jgi:hypothetical protein